MSKPVAVIVGASGEIGSSIARAVASRGATIVGVGRSKAPLSELKADIGSSDFQSVVADISEDGCIQTIEGAVSGNVRMVVLAAGVPVAGGVETVAPEAISNAINVKVNGFIRLVRAVEAKLSKHSRLVAIGGHYGFEPSPYAATAGVANAALTNLVRQMNWAYGQRGITAHLVAPGPAYTERLRRVIADRAQLAGSSVEDEMLKMVSESAIGALTDPRAIGWMVANLLDEEADALAGSSIFMDAGRRRGLP